MILLAHDGSVYCDWVARYALNFAEQEDDRKLLVLHILEEARRREIIEEKFFTLEQECRGREIDFSSHVLPIGSTIYRSLRQAIPHRPESLLICGTRVKPNKRSLLRGSIAEKLLRTHQCPVLALRVVQPGLLGDPHDLMLPLAGHASGFGRVWPVFRRLSPHLRRLHLFRALTVNPLLLPHLTPTREHTLMEIGVRHLDAIGETLEQHLGPLPFHLERRVVISAAWPEDVLLQASRIKAQVILLGVSERNLAHRLMHGDGVERVLRQAPCDVGIYRGT